jgi:hypothetical protein
MNGKIFRIENMYNFYLIIEKLCPMAPGTGIGPSGRNKTKNKIENIIGNGEIQ